MRFNNYFVVDCNGKSGGLGLLWKVSVSVQVTGYSQHCIDAIVKKKGLEWRITGFYGIAPLQIEIIEELRETY